MNILDNYTKKPSSPLQSVTIKLPQEMVDAVREFNINLGAVVRDMLKDSDLMHTYKGLNGHADAKVTDGFSEEYFAFEYDGVCYYKHINDYWIKDNSRIVTESTKNPFYRVKKLQEAKKDEK